MKLLQFAGMLFPAVILLSCKKEQPVSQKDTFAQERRINNEIFRSEPVAMGNGHIRSFVRMADHKTPIELGVEIEAGAMNGLPHSHQDFILPLPAVAKSTTAYDHIFLNWNPHGHEPLIFYSAPHFDFHFYTIPSGERSSIPEYNPSTAKKFDKAPADGFIPAAYFPAPGGEPQMGKHWIDPASPEFQPGGNFTSTMIYGSYNGRVIFIEPMITRDFILSAAAFDASFPQPLQFSPVNKYYPGRYRVYQENGMHYISLSDFVLR